MATRTKPPKPSPDYPLFAHPNGSWAKKIKGKCYYFGPWNDPEGALRAYREAFPNGATMKAASDRDHRPYLDATISQIQLQIADLEERIAEKKRIVNQLCNVAGQPPIYTE